jgi:hypothetical protein
MLIRFSKKSKPVEISTDEFDKLVKKGKLTPKSLVKNKFIAKGKWVSIANMERFHRKSPIDYPPGAYLIESREIEDRRKKESALFQANVANYESGKMIEQYLALIPVNNLCGHFKVPVASRLTVMPAFHPELVITLLLSLDSISVDMIRGTTQIWGSWVKQEENPFDLTKAYKISVELSFSKKVYPFNDIVFFLEQAKEAVDCYTLATDGVGFRHEVVSYRTDIDVRWSNPTDEEHPAQCHLISSYSNVVREAMLRIVDRKNSNDITEATSWELLVNCIWMDL